MSSQALAGVRNLNSLLQIPSIRPKTQVKRRNELENLIDRSPDREIRIPSLARVSDSISESPDLSPFRSFLTRSKRFARRGNDFRSLAFFFFFPHWCRLEFVLLFPSIFLFEMAYDLARSSRGWKFVFVFDVASNWERLFNLNRIWTPDLDALIRFGILLDAE